MPQLELILDGVGCWPDLPEKEVIEADRYGAPLQVALLDEGMSNGKPSVTLRIDLPDGKVVLAQTSARLFVDAANAISARYPNLFEDE